MHFWTKTNMLKQITAKLFADCKISKQIYGTQIKLLRNLRT